MAARHKPGFSWGCVSCDREDRVGQFAPTVAGGAVAARVHERWANLVAGWKLNETSDGSAPVARADVLGVYELTDNNTVASAAGKIGNAASFAAASNERLSRADTNNALDGGNTNYSVVAWFYRTGTGGAPTILSKAGAGSNDDYYLRINGANLEFLTRGSLDVVTTPSASDVWNFVVASNDIAAGKTGISLNGAAPTLHTNGGPGTPFDGDFSIGSYRQNVLPWNGLIDEVYFFSRVLTNQDILDLYNAGAGRSYPD